jgi:type VI secretion system protein ImpE
MTPRDALADGRLGDAIEWQEAAVRDSPDDAAARLFLFELLTLAGRRNDARDQLRAITSDDPTWPAVRRGFELLLKAEAARIRGERTRFGDEPAHIKVRWRAFRAIQVGRAEEAAAWIDRADTASPAVAGHVDGREFEGLRDTDDRFGSVLEAFVGPAYVWLPFEQVRRIALTPAAGVLDAAFRPVQLRLMDGRELAVTLPLLYPGSHRADGVFATGLETDWPDAGGPACGVGARVWMVGEEELVLGDCRQFELRPG